MSLTTPATRGPLALLAHEARYATLASMRNPRARFFTFMFPILLLVIFSSVLGHDKTTVVDGTQVSLSRYFVGGIVAMSIITAAYAGLVVSIAGARESGVLKRRRATPVPPAILIGGQALATWSRQRSPRCSCSWSPGWVTESVSRSDRSPPWPAPRSSGP